MTYQILRFCIAFVFTFSSGITSTKALQPDPEVYSALPTLEDMQISADGQTLGYLYKQKGNEGLLIFDLTTNRSSGFNTRDIKANDVFFSNNDYAVLTGPLENPRAPNRSLERGLTFSYDINKKSVNYLLLGSPELRTNQSLANIVGKHSGENTVYMHALYGEGRAPSRRHLIKVNLTTGRGRIHKRGLPETIDWYVDKQGEIIARTDFDRRANEFSIFQYNDRKQSVLKFKRENASQFRGTIGGIKSDKSAFIVTQRTPPSGATSVFEMGFDGKMSTPIFNSPNKSVARLLTDTNRMVYGVEYEGLYPTYEFFDDNLTSLVKQIQNNFDGLSVTIMDWTDNFDKLILKIEGGLFTPGFYMYDRSQGGVLKVTDSYPIKAENIADVIMITYPARDGLKIPAVVTRPPTWSGDKQYPLIVLPRNRPAAYNAVGFDWMAQYFAAKGYIVLQPNFRGSTGFGEKLRNAGTGEWGAKMQDDITDAVKALTKLGWVDKGQTCIVGSGYGGYAALAGGAYTPELYQCVVAIAPIADLNAMLKWEQSNNQAGGWVNQFWSGTDINNPGEQEKLKNRSPAASANKFQSPVLLIHSANDSVVPIAQSETMRGALEGANKTVKFERLNGDDHQLAKSETRLQVLNAMTQFIETHIKDR